MRISACHVFRPALYTQAESNTSPTFTQDCWEQDRGGSYPDGYEHKQMRNANTMKEDVRNIVL